MKSRSFIQNTGASLLTFVAAMTFTPEADAGGTPSVPTHYSIVDLGTLGGSFTLAIGVNNSGQVTGLGTTAGDAAVHAFLLAKREDDRCRLPRRRLQRSGPH